MIKHQSYFYKPKAKTQAEKPKWVVLPVLWKVLKRVCMGLGALMLISLTISFFTVMSLVQMTTPEVPDEMILFYRLEGSLVEGPTGDGLSSLGKRPLSLKNVIDTLDVAATDDRVKALIVNARSSGLSMSQMQELRGAIKQFRQDSGKPAYIYSLSYGEAGGLGLYAFASAFDGIWLHPLGTLSIPGLRLEQPYFKALLDKLGVNPQFYQREEYKGVFDMVKAQEMPEATRESLDALANDMVDHMINDIVTDRPQVAANKQEFMDLVNQGFFLDKEALEANLVDKVEYGDVLLDQLREEKLDGDVEEDQPALINLKNYLHVIEYEKQIASKDVSKNKGKDHVSVIFVEGPIMILQEGESGNGLFGKTSLSADKISGLIVEAAEQEATKAIVLRVNSPGGSPTASEIIRRAVVRAREKGKPVIVSMSDSAASGGYWLSASADYIFANPSTITGSIGVAGGKASFKDLWSKLYVNWDHIQIGQNAGMYSINESFSAREEALVQKMMSNTYSMFLDIVAEGRGMTKDEAREVAKGRVWTGAQALERGLVDQLGGFNDALDYAAQQAGKESRKDLNIIFLPEPKSALEEILSLLAETASAAPMMQSTMETLNVIAQDQEKVLQDLSVISRNEPVLIYDSSVELR